MTTTQTPTLTKIEDHEGEGTCGYCGREGLRWVATLSDGTRAGLECAKKVMGWKPPPKSYAWIADFRIVAEHIDGIAYGGGPAVHILWQHKSGTQTRETLNGTLQAVGSVSAEWTRRGWL